ncbi:hypothetical protein DID88_008449 [Monilinia fructigena]|uniref:Uncharacterized protein n=1 Tax=Monilinia fructigena TaxID=38457 RepID=A0A395J5V1_9HELO|nr:hypothetical protein DID88_008449 [Monilinia fructigena]
MSDSWFPTGKEVREGWRLDIVSLLAVIGESAMAEHSQSMTSSWMCMLPRIIPAPQVLLKSARPSRMPQVNAAVVGVHSGIFIPTLNFFPNIIHPIEDLEPYEFKVFEINHSNSGKSPPPPTSTNKEREFSNSSSIDAAHLESGRKLQPRRRDTLAAKITHRGTKLDGSKPHVPARFWCNEDVARELYSGTEECRYYVSTDPYRILVGFGTFLLMVSVVLLGNCDFQMQISIGVSYIVLNGAFWGVALMNKGRFWDLSSYEWKDITPESAKYAHLLQHDTDEGKPSFTRTLWYAIRETKKIGWVSTSGAAPKTKKWEEWLNRAEAQAKEGNEFWDAVHQKDTIVGVSDSVPQAAAASKDTAAEHAPRVQVPVPDWVDTERIHDIRAEYP